ncbi:MAG: peptidylprolyl isomerase, partial [Planctomycetota bacterium]
MSLQLSRAEFAAAARFVVARQLDSIIENELVLSEARSELTEEQRAGLLFWISQLRDDQARRAGGAEAVADARLREERGVTLDEEIEQIQTRELMRRQIMVDVLNRVDVTWRDIQRHYRNNYDEYNPPAQIQIALIVVRQDDEETRAAVESDLQSGRSFEETAAERSRLLRSRGGLMDVVSLSEGIEQTSLTRWPEVDALARSLEQGEFGGPVQPEDSDDLIWVYVNQLTDGTGRSLYEVQHEIETQLRNAQFGAELSEYLEELAAAAGVDDRETMVDILWFVAMSRYAPDA